MAWTSRADQAVAPSPDDHDRMDVVVPFQGRVAARSISK